MQAFNSRKLGELCNQLKITQTWRRKQYVERAEAFVQQVDPQKTYSYREVLLALTDFETREPAGRGIAGRAVVADLVLLIGAAHLVP